MKRLLQLGTVALGVTAAALVGVQPVSSAPADPVVRTEAGPVHGIVAEDHRSFQGIP